MALTGTNRGTATHNTATSSWVITPPQNFTAGSFAILCLAMDNTGGGGAAQTVTVADSVGNTWTDRATALYDPGTASSGVLVKAFTAPISTLTTANTITVTLGASTTAKVATLTEAVSSTSIPIDYVKNSIGVGSGNTVSQTSNTFEVISGNMVVGLTGAEGAPVWTSDPDSTNGAWSTPQSTVAGTGATGMAIISQYKVTTGTGNQVFNTSMNTLLDIISAIIEIAEVPGSYDPFGQQGFFGM